MVKATSCFQKIIIYPIVLYQRWLSPVLKPCCRFYPSCSQYSIEAIVHFGILKGGWMSIRRLLRCHPWSQGGYDAVLPIEEKK